MSTFSFISTNTIKQTEQPINEQTNGSLGKMKGKTLLEFTIHKIGPQKWEAMGSLSVIFIVFLRAPKANNEIHYVNCTPHKK